MGFLLSCSHVSTSAWMHHLNSVKMQREKARWELHKNAISCLEKIWETAPHKTSAIWSLNFHHTNHPNKMNDICWALLVK